MDRSRNHLTAGAARGATIESLECRRMLSAAALPSVIRINAAGSTYVDTFSRSFEGDSGFLSGEETFMSVPDVTDGPLFATFRNGSEFAFRRTIANGRYLVVLEFADLQSIAAGQRVMDVTAEGALVVNDFDIVKSVGTGQPTARAFMVDIKDVAIDMTFTGVVGEAMVSAIVLVPLDIPSAVLPYTINAASDTAKEVMAGSNLRTVGQAMQMYAGDHKGQFPASLAALYLEQEEIQSYVTDPRLGTLEPRGELSAIEGAAWVATLDDFLYVRPAKGNAAPPETVVAYENPSKVSGSINILFGDGSVHFVDRATAGALIGFDPAAPVAPPPALPTIPSADPKITQSMNQLRQFALPLQQYAINNRGNYPVELGSLYSYGVRPPLVVNPRISTTTPPPGMSESEAIAFINASTDYLYLEGKRNSSSMLEALIFENPGTLSDGIGLLMADGRVEFREMRWAMETLSRSNQRATSTVPRAVIGGTTTLTEGQPTILYAGGIGRMDWPSLTQQVVAWEWDLDYNGLTFNVDAGGQSINLPADEDGPATRMIGLRVRNVAGTYSSISTSTLTIRNAPPSAVLQATPVTLGEATTVQFLYASDPSSADAAAGFRYSLDFNNDGDFNDPGDVLNSAVASALHVFPSTGTFSVHGRITDKDGGFADRYATVSVTPPVVTVTTISASADAYVRNGTYASTNFGSTTNIDVKKDGTGLYREGYFTFDLSTVSSITSAKFRIFGKLTTAMAGGLNAGVFSVADTSWTESGINFNNKPVSGTTALTQVNIASTVGKYYEFDVTSYLQQQKALGKTLISFDLKALNSGVSMLTFNSRNASSNQPQLVVTQGTIVPPQAIVVSTPALTVPEGSSNAFTVKLATAPAANVTVNITKTSGDPDLTAAIASLVFTPANWNTAQTVNISAAEDADTTNSSALFTITSTGLASQTLTATEADNDVPPPSTVTLGAVADAYVRNGTSASTNFGSTTNIDVKKDGTGLYREGYFTFDLSTLTSITSAKFRIFGKLTTAMAGGLNAGLFSVADTSWTESGITYANKPVSGTTALAQVNIAGTTGQYYDFNVTSYLQQQKALGKTLVSFDLKALNSGISMLTFNSRNASNNPPQLVVNG